MVYWSGRLTVQAKWAAGVSNPINVGQNATQAAYSSPLLFKLYRDLINMLSETIGGIYIYIYMCVCVCV